LAAGNVKLRNGAVHGEGDESKDEDWLHGGCLLLCFDVYVCVKDDWWGLHVAALFIATKVCFFAFHYYLFC
jgi:hypothetical protein